ncbi:MOSC domain-containing protein [Candidatus Gracilibacteria bacterium]|nr:MOSC domain-containing protein [Candidatus Gracilibacteria bacterium]NJM88356.1 MOSC domain-containing protein [Hydrococcus sp. RU_2_2]NJP20255.1 MOSC domain-containing protein [Hydrococcus sp. CRU_1_1]
MIASPHLARISIYPIKSLDGIFMTQATILESGALKTDREFALIDEKGNFVNGKRNAKVHLLRVQFNDELQSISLKVQGTEQKATFNLDNEKTELEAWLSYYFGFVVQLKQNTITGFPDDLNAKGATIISTATIEEVTSWYPGISVEEMRSRLRANLEIDGVPAFWEDCLFTEAGQCVRFTVGDVLFEGINPCQRCVVPTRDAKTGEATINFQKIFIKKRRETLPKWTVPARFNHFYRLSVNTNVPASEAGKVVRVGDALAIIGVSESQLS